MSKLDVETLKTKDNIAQLMPHGIDICLLDEIEFSDSDSITALSKQPLLNNVLLVDGQLFCEIGVEFGAQTAAIHAALQSDRLFVEKDGGEKGVNEKDNGEKESGQEKPSKPAFVAAVKSMKLSANIDHGVDLIKTKASKMMSSPLGSIYSFQCWADDTLWCEGRLSLMMPDDTK